MKVGYLVEKCFELNGYPNWYKGGKGKRALKSMVQVEQEAPLKSVADQNMNKITNSYSLLVSRIYWEVLKVLQTTRALQKHNLDQKLHYVGYISVLNSFLGSFFIHDNSLNDLIVDRGAMDCITPFHQILTNIYII